MKITRKSSYHVSGYTSFCLEIPYNLPLYHEDYCTVNSEIIIDLFTVIQTHSGHESNLFTYYMTRHLSRENRPHWGPELLTNTDLCELENNQYIRIKFI